MMRTKVYVDEEDKVSVDEEDRVSVDEEYKVIVDEEDEVSLWRRWRKGGGKYFQAEERRHETKEG